MNVRALVVLAVASMLAACGGDDPATWSDAADAEWIAVIAPTTVVEGERWRMDAGTEPYDTGESTGSCLQLVVAEQPLGCITLGADPGNEYGFGVAVRAGGERVIWRASTITDEEPPVSHFVVWSSASPDGRRVEPVRYGDVESLVWIMETGEAPWGYQTIAPDGTLVASWSYVGLPAD